MADQMAGPWDMWPVWWTCILLAGLVAGLMAGLMAGLLDMWSVLLTCGWSGELTAGLENLWLD